MVTRLRAKKKIVEVPRLRHDGENWLDYRGKLFEAAEQQGLLGLLDGTNTKPNEPWNPWRIAAWLRDDTEAQYLLATTTPSIIWNHFTISTAHDMFRHLQSLFESTATTTATVHEMWSIDSTQVAAHTPRTPDDHVRTRRAARTESRHVGREDNGRSHRVTECVASANARRRTRGKSR